MTDWLGGLDLPFQSSGPDSQTYLAIRVWNLMNGQLDWHALNIITVIMGITDIELLIAQLDTIKNYGNEPSSR